MSIIEPQHVFKNALKTFLRERSPEEIKEFFKQEFHTPLDAVFLGDMTVPAETIRLKRIQTNHIEKYLLTLRDK